MRHSVPACAAILGLCLSPALAQPEPGPPETSTGRPLFTFRSGFWVNLHHFLYVLGRARNNESDSRRVAVTRAPAESAAGIKDLADADRQVWSAAVAWYQHDPSTKDPVFDRDLIAATTALAAAGDAPTLAAARLPAPWRRVLESAGPVYR